MLQNDLLLRVAKGESVDRPPVWLMRQAGRILPQYRAVREKLSGFKELATTPELACEVTIQPVDELDVDAAIIFSDILVVPEAMGCIYEMEEKRGPRFPNTIKTAQDIEALLSGAEAAANLEYVYESLRLTKKALNGRVPLIGFAGAPWTILAYMIEGSGSKTFSAARAFLYREPELARQLLDKITDTTISYLHQQVDAGADLVQIFDSWAGILSPDLYQQFSLPYLLKISDSLSPRVPVTLFAKDAWYALPWFAASSCRTIGLDWTITPSYARQLIGTDKTLQGNFDPCLLYADFDTIRREATKMIQQMGRPHIVNLGHGVYPDTPLDGVKCFVDTVKAYRY
jgi:uroporphyrinogen decarboxylase